MVRWVFVFVPAVVFAVPTPWGDRPASCVVEVPEGSTIVPHQDGVAMQHTSGEIQPVRVADECRNGTSGRQTSRRSGGWLDNKGWTHNAGFGKFAGSWNVPANPPSPQRPETLYYFFGMENLVGGPVNILQPVLTWGDETEGAIGGWSIWSWACCPSDITFNSKNVGGLKEGMIVDGVIEKTDSQTWRIDTAFSDESGNRQNTTLLANLGRYTYTWADVTLEVYNISNCGQHSPGEVTFTDLELHDENGAKLTPQWSGASSSSCGGRVTVHDTTSISIQHSTGDDITV